MDNTLQICSLILHAYHAIMCFFGCKILVLKGVIVILQMSVSLNQIFYYTDEDS